jgi:hypothetical protein
LERKTCEKRALQFAVLSRLEKCNALFSGELRAFLIAAQPIRKWRVEGGAGALAIEVRAALTMYPPCRDEISARPMITQSLR